MATVSQIRIRGNDRDIMDAFARSHLYSMVDASNLYNLNADNNTENTILLNDNTTTPSDVYFVTDYIEVVTPGEYTVSNTLSSPGCAYDANKNFVAPIYSATGGHGNSPKTFTLPSGVKYVRLNVSYLWKNTFVFTKGKYTKVNKYGSKTLEGAYENSNLYSGTGLTVNNILLADGTTTPSETFSISGYIEIPGTGKYTVPYSLSTPGCIYDSEKELLGTVYTHSGSADEVYTFEITNTNARYVRLNIKNATISTFRFFQGSVLTDIPYGAKVVDGQSVFQKDVIGRWYGRPIAVFGDSRTWYDGQEYGENTKPAWQGKVCKGYQQAIAKLTNARLINKGGNGETSTQICTRIRAYDFSNIDAVILDGGVNDFIKSDQVTIGQIASIGANFNTSTVYGAWQSAIEYILRNYPKTKIFVLIPAIAWSSAGVFPYNTAKIKGEIAELYNLPCLDLYKKGGLSVCNYDYYYADNVSTTGWHLHFNDYGNELIGNIIAGFIMNA